MKYWFRKKNSYIPAPRRFPFEPIDWRGYVFFLGWLAVSGIGATLLSQAIGGRQGEMIALAFVAISSIFFVFIAKAKTEP